MTLSLWIDPDEDGLGGSPEPDRVETIADKSDAGNDLVAKANVALLCGFNGTNGATSYSSDDDNAYSFTFVSGAQLSNAQTKFGATSLDVLNALDYIRVTPSPGTSLSPGTGDFTIEFWVYPTGTSGYAAAFDQRTAANSVCVYIGINSSSKWVLYVSAADRIISGANAAANVWSHICVERVSGTSRLFINGIQEGSDYADTNNYGANDTTIGARSAHNNGGGIIAYIDDFRMVLGTAVHGGVDFIPNTAPLTGVELGTDIGGLVKGFDFDLDYRLEKANASPVLTNMDGPNITAVIAYQDRGTDVPVAGQLFGVSGLASPLDDTGWRIKDVLGNGVYRASVGDEDTNYIDMFGDPESVSCDLLANFDGADAATAYTSLDRSKRTATLAGTAQLDTAEKKFGLSSVLLDGNSDYVTFPDSDDWHFVDDFTVEFWVNYRTTPTGNNGMVSNYDSSISQQGWLIQYNATTNVIQVYAAQDGAGAVTAQFNSSWTPTINTWYHIALSRKDMTSRLFVDGVKISGDETAINFAIHNSTAPLAIGVVYGGGGLVNYHDGWFDDIRIIRGKGIYTANFTAPTRSYADSRAVIDDSDAAILSMVYDSTRSSLYGFNSGNDAGGVTYTGTPGFLHDLKIGEGRFGRVFGPVYFDGVLSSDDIQRVEGYMAHHYNLVHALSVGHPFELTGPDIVETADFIATFQGTDDGTTYTDDTGVAAWTFSGNAKLTANESKFGGTSLVLDGTDDWIETPDNAVFELGSNDFTIEAWVAPDLAASAGVVVGKYNFNSARSWFLAFVAGELQFFLSSDGISTAQSYIATDTPTITPGEFVHIAASRVGSEIYTFFNGVSLTGYTRTVTGGAHNNASKVVIGDTETGGNDWAGAIDSIRLIKGRAVYKENFTPPRRSFRSPVTAALIANFNGLDAVSSPPGYTSEDAGARSASFIGNAQLDTAQKRFGVSSLLCDGTGDYVTFPDSADYEFADGDFTAECWVRWSAAPGATVECFVGKWDVSGNQREWLFYYGGNLLKFGWSTDGTNGTFNSVQTPAWTPDINRWYHVAAEREGDVLRFWIDGEIISSHAVTATFFTGTSVLMVGGNNQTGQDFTGWIDGVRLVKGETLYGSVQIPETAFNQATDSSELLINFEGADGSQTYTTNDAVGRSLTFSGTCEIDTAERRVGTSSLNLGAQTDGCIIPSAADLALGTGDFTIEFFFRASSFPAGAQILYDQRNAGTSVFPAIYVTGTSGNLRYYVNGADRITGNNLTTVNKWFHICVERVNGITRLYQDGVEVGTAYTDSNNYLQNAIYLGEASYSPFGSGALGWMDMVRVSVGSAIHFGDFTPPTMPPGEPIV
jgi:hypothetical protein